jgi:hypothetical protein
VTPYLRMRVSASASTSKSATRGSRADRGVRPTFTILDVEVDVEFCEDADGRMSFIAEPQQRAFFRAMRFDQLAAQLRP